MEKKFLTLEELNGLKKINEDNQNLVVSYGQIEYQIQLLKVQKQNLNEQLKINKNSEIEFFKELETKYGIMNINLETGEITPVN